MATLTVAHSGSQAGASARVAPRRLDRRALARRRRSMSAASGATSEWEACTGWAVLVPCVRVRARAAGWRGHRAFVRGAAWAHLGRAGRLLTDPRQRRRRHDVENYLPPVRAGVVVVRLRKCEGVAGVRLGRAATSVGQLSREPRSRRCECSFVMLRARGGCTGKGGCQHTMKSTFSCALAPRILVMKRPAASEAAIAREGLRTHRWVMVIRSPTRC